LRAGGSSLEWFGGQSRVEVKYINNDVARMGKGPGRGGGRFRVWMSHGWGRGRDVVGGGDLEFGPRTERLVCVVFRESRIIEPR